MIPYYEGERFLAKTLETVLEQDPGPELMQIEVIDDCSPSGSPSELVRDIGKGRVKIHRHEKNGGIAATFTTCVRRARGRWVHILHCDDWVINGFYSEMEKLIEQHPEAGAAVSRTFITDETDRKNGLYGGPPWMKRSGIIDNAAHMLRISNFIPTPSIVVKRETYENVGGYALELAHGTDWEMWMRVADFAPILFLDEPLAVYRVSEGQHSAEAGISGSALDEYYVAIAMGAAKLPPAERRKVFREARVFLSKRAFTYRNRASEDGYVFAPLRWAFISWRMQPNFLNSVRLGRAAGFFLRDAIKQPRRRRTHA